LYHTFSCGYKPRWFDIRIMYQIRATCLSTDCCFSELGLNKIQVSLLILYKVSNVFAFFRLTRDLYHTFSCGYKPRWKRSCWTFNWRWLNNKSNI
jgi:hypothetical protein